MTYSVLYADPPWKYNSRKACGERRNKTKFGGGAGKHYPLMADNELVDMKPFIDSISYKNCILFMWVTMPRMDFGIRLMKSWGFRFCTNGFTWVKLKKPENKMIKFCATQALVLDVDKCMPKRIIYGPGYYTASNVELCLIGVKGSMRPDLKMCPSVILAPRGRHSEKPSQVRSYIEEMYPSANRIELFARQRFEGWDSWGNEEGNDSQS